VFKQYSDWDFVPVGGSSYAFQIIKSDSEEVCIRENVSFFGFNTAQKYDNRINEAGYVSYDIQILIQELHNQIYSIVRENERYYMPTKDEYLNEYRYNRSRFLKNSEKAEATDDVEIDVLEEIVEESQDDTLDIEGVENEME